jgi:phage-related minor tail protein
MTTATRDYVFRLRGDADQLAQAHERAAAAADRHADQTADLVRQQAAAKTAQDNFIAGLKRQADSLGKSRSELAAMQAAELGVSQQAAPLIARLQAGDKAAAGFAKSGKLTAIELQQVGLQLNDLAVQVASGSNPITALVQQGSQLSGTFGGVRPAMSAVLSLLTPARVLFGGVAATVGLLATAYIQAQREEARFRDGLVLSGNAAGVTRGSYESLVATVQQATGVTVGASRDIVQGLVATGRVGPAAIASVSQAAATLAKISGASADEVAKDFAGMSAGVAQWALNANKAYNFLTPEIYRHIRALEAQGKTEEAMRVASEALNKALTGRTRELGWLEKAWDGVKQGASAAWDAMLNVGREQTTGERIVAMARALGDARAQLARGDQRAAPLVAAMETQLETLRLLQKGEQSAAKQRADDTKANNEGLLREQEQYQSASAQLQRSGFALQQAQAEAARQAELDGLQRSYETGETGLAAYVARRTVLEQQALDAKRASIEQEMALERQRQAGSPAEALQQQARLNDLLARRVALQREQLKLTADARRNFGVNTELRDPIGDAEASFAKRIDDYATRNQAALDRVQDQAERAALELLEANQALSVSLITDDRVRGEAQIALEREQLLKRIDMTVLAAEERQQAEAAVADYVALRQQQLTEQLKPELDRQLELWEDYGRRRIQVQQDVARNFVDSGRSAFGQMFVDGKFSLDNLAQYAARTLGEQLFERLGFGRTFAQLGDIVFSGIESVVGRVAGAGEAANPSAERDVLRRMEAAAAEEIAATATSVLAKGREAVITDTATGAVARLGYAAEAAASRLGTLGAGGGDASSLLGSLFGSGGGFFNDAGGLEVAGSLGFAKGGAFVDGVVQRFARGGLFGRGGGVLREPTVFPMARGMGIAAEAGEPEAVMPLRRTRDGRLGVEMAGGGGGVAAPVFNFYTPPGTTVERRDNGTGGQDVYIRLKDQLRGDLGSEIDSGTGLAGNIGNRFALNGGAGLIR